MKKAVFIFLLSMTLIACGGSESSTGGSQDAKTDAGTLTGVYKGTETMKLIKQSDDSVVEETTNDATISVARSGVLSISTQGGTSGTAQLRNDNGFSLVADARTQFNGACESGEITLNGRIDGSTITADYSSTNLVCKSEEHRIEGSISLTK